MKVALAQINPIVGAFSRNLQIILCAIKRAREMGCELIIFPELTLCGSPPQGFLADPSFFFAHNQALMTLINQVEGIACIIGVLERHETEKNSFYNTALVLKEKKILAKTRKQVSPKHAGFHETGCFQSKNEPCIFKIGDFYYGLSIHSDMLWNESDESLYPLRNLETGSLVPDCLINISASHYYHGKLDKIQQTLPSICRENALPLLYVNQVGGQDSLVFDGHSMAIDKNGTIRALAAGFAEDLLLVDSENWESQAPCLLMDSIAQVERALILGMRDYFSKSGFTKAVLGLSGGIDSAVTAVLACRALGPENVLCVALPSPYTSRQSVDEAKELARRLACKFEIIAINPLMDAFQAVLAPIFSGTPENLAEQNIQSRIRGDLLMSLSNKFGYILLTTGNKSEVAVGYCTLYGDTCGGLAVIADLPKQMVYDLAHHMNRDEEVIPQGTITRPPSAELKPDQTDQDDLPPYEVLDAVLHAYFAEGKTAESIAEEGIAEPQMIHEIVRRVMRNEYKRRQLPPALLINTPPVRLGRQYPLAQGFFT